MRRAHAALVVALAVLPAAVFGQSANIGRNFLGTTNTTQSAVSGILLSPPDSMGSVGPNYFVMEYER